MKNDNQILKMEIRGGLASKQRRQRVVWKKQDGCTLGPGLRAGMCLEGMKTVVEMGTG